MRTGERIRDGFMPWAGLALGTLGYFIQHQLGSDAVFQDCRIGSPLVVIIGTIFLIVCLVRAMRGHFSPTQHLGFEFAAWYWHFVDVVWLFLFASIYVWGSWGISHVG